MVAITKLINYCIEILRKGTIYEIPFNTIEEVPQEIDKRIPYFDFAMVRLQQFFIRDYQSIFVEVIYLS